MSRDILVNNDVDVQVYFLKMNIPINALAINAAESFRIQRNFLNT